MKGTLFLILLGFTAVRPDVVWQYENYTVLDPKFLCFGYDIEGVSEKCGEMLNVACSNISLLMTMLDASSKFPYTGLGFASRTDYGNFDQCMTIDHQYDGGRILGEHCTVGLAIPDISNISDLNLYYRLAVCRPEGCTASDYNTMLTQNLNITLPLFQETMCSTKYTGNTLTAADYFTLVLIFVVVQLMVISTIYDFYLEKKQAKPRHPLFLAFSVLSNGRKLLHVSKNSKDQIQTFHGLKVISMMWIVAGHGYVAWESVSVTDEVHANTWLDHISAVYIRASYLAVDTFFYISGFLLAYQYLKQKPKPLMAHIATVPHMYLHRYLRLTPALLAVYMVAISIFRHFGKGPIYHYMSEALSDTCRKRWWPLFLYIQNYYNWDDLCMTQTWYLSADMQMFLLAPIVLIPITIQLKNKSGFLVCMVELFVLNLFCIALPMAIKLKFQDYANTYDTHSRLINYFVGVMLGVFMRVKHDKPFLYMVDRRKVSLANLIIWGVILIGMLAIVFCLQIAEMDYGFVGISIFYSLARPGWCIGLSWIVYSCYHGYGGFVNWVLCRPIFQIWGRLTYCMYLVHGLVMAYYVLTIRTRWYFNDYNAFYLFCGHYTVSTIVATFWTLAFESPLISIERFIFGGTNKKKPQDKSERNGNAEEGASYKKNSQTD